MDNGLQLNLYIATMYADRDESKASASGAAFLAHSEDEALGIAYRVSREQYPISEGWSNHKIATSFVPLEMLRKVVESR